MIRSLKLFAACVESMRTAEQAYEEAPTPFNRNILSDLQKKVDAWIQWVRQQQDAELAKGVPPFINRRSSTGGYQGVSADIMQQLMANHTPEEIERYTKLMQDNL